MCHPYCPNVCVCVCSPGLQGPQTIVRCFNQTDIALLLYVVSPRSLLPFKRQFSIELELKRRKRQWHPTPVLLPGKSRGRRSLVGCSPWGHEESDTTERLHFHFSLLCIGEGNGNPLQCSCLENLRDGVAQSRTRLK